MSIRNSLWELTSDTLLPGSDQNPSWKNVKGFQSGCKGIKGPDVLNVRSATKLKISHLYLFPCMFMMILYANINTYFSLRAKCWLRGGMGGQFPRNV